MRRMRARRAALAGAAAAAAGLLLGCRGRSLPPSVRHPLLNAEAPSFEAEGSGARAVGVPAADFLTRVIVLDFWASWCAACVVSMPALDALFRERQTEGVMVIGVSVDESEGAAAMMAQRLQASFPIVMDPDRRIANDYGVFQIPLTFVIDGGGRVVWVGNDPNGARRAVDWVLSEGLAGRRPVLE